MDNLETRAKIRLRLLAIEKTLAACLGDERVAQVKKNVHRRLEISRSIQSERSGIAKPTVSTRGLYRE